MQSSFQGFSPKQIKEASKKLEQALQEAQVYAKQTALYKEGALKAGIWKKLKKSLF